MFFLLYIWEIELLLIWEKGCAGHTVPGFREETHSLAIEAPMPMSSTPSPLNKLIGTPKCFAFSYSFSLLLWSSLDGSLASDHGNHSSQSPLDLRRANQNETSRMQDLALIGNRLLTRTEALAIWNKAMD